MNTVWVVTKKEFRDSVRNRWVIAVTLLFMLLALGLAYFGAAASGRVGFQSFDATVASLTTLAAFIIPLIGLLIAYDTVVGEFNSGTLLLLLSYPLTRIQVLVGKYLGQSAVMATATLLGFGVAVGVIQLLTPAARSPGAWGDMLGFVVSGSLLGASFVGMACLISVVTRDKSRAAGIALLVWFGLVIVFDLLLLAALVASGGNGFERLIYPYLLLLNPIDVFRLVNLMGLGAGAGNETFVGMTGGHHYQPLALYAVLVLWSLAPFAASLMVFRRQEL